MADRITFFILFLGIALLFSTSSADHGNKEAHNEEGHKPKFNYTDPKKWGSLSPEFAKCSAGKRQSPITISTKDVHHNKTLGPLLSYYHVNNASLICNGLVVEVALDVKSELKIDGKSYKLAQMHWHTPAEHRINGNKYPAELHQVHKSDDGSVAVIGILYKYGNPDPIVKAIIPQLNEVIKKKKGEDIDEEIEINIGSFPSMLIKDRPYKYYRYSGSLTTPPCSEPVTWTIMSPVKTMSKAQVEALRGALNRVNKRNSRPVQAVNGRKIEQFQ